MVTCNRKSFARVGEFLVAAFETFSFLFVMWLHMKQNTAICAKLSSYFTCNLVFAVYCTYKQISDNAGRGGSGDKSNIYETREFFCYISPSYVLAQMIYLNRALDVFNTAVVTPLLYVIFTGCVILASAVLFREWSSLSAEDVVGNLCGLLVIVAGIFLLQAFRDISGSAINLPRLRKDDSRRATGSTSYPNLPAAEQTNVNIETSPLRSSSGAHLLSSSSGGEYHSRSHSYSY